MYTGNLIQELLETVERVEEQALHDAELELKKSVRSPAGFSTHFYERILSEQHARG